VRFGRARFGRDIDLALLRAISAWVCFAVGFRFVWLFSGRQGCFHGIQLAKLPRVALTASLDVKRAPQTQNSPRTTPEQPQNAPERPQNAPERPQNAPRTPQNVPRMLQSVPRMLHNDARMTSSGSIWEYIRSSGSILDNLGTPGGIWLILGPSEYLGTSRLFA
jgi:hypothetical protein